MDEHVQPDIAACLHKYWPIPIDTDHLAREQAMRERDYERQRMAHPDPRDPDHPGDDDE